MGAVDQDAGAVVRLRQPALAAGESLDVDEADMISEELRVLAQRVVEGVVKDAHSSPGAEALDYRSRVALAPDRAAWKADRLHKRNDGGSLRHFEHFGKNVLMKGDAVRRLRPPA